MLTLLAVMLPLVHPPRATAATRSTAAVTIARKLNYARTHHGLPPLRVRAHLNDVAYRQAVRMANRGVLYHNPNLAAEVHGDWRWVGENVGYGPDALTVHRSFMASPAHRGNILDRDYDDVGTAAVRRDGRLWVVEVFRGW